MEKDHKKFSIVENRIETKLSLRKVKLKEQLTKKKVEKNIKLERNSGLYIDVEKLGLKSDILNKQFYSNDFEEYISYHSSLLTSPELKNNKYSVNAIRLILVSLDQNIPSIFTSTELLSKFYFLLNKYPKEYDLVNEILWIFINISSNYNLSFFVSTGMLQIYDKIISKFYSLVANSSDNNNLSKDNEFLINEALFEGTVWICGNLAQDQESLNRYFELKDILEKLIKIDEIMQKNKMKVSKLRYCLYCFTVFVNCFGISNKLKLINWICDTQASEDLIKEEIFALSLISNTEEILILNKISNSGKIKFYLNLYFSNENKEIEIDNIILPLTKLIGNLLSLKSSSEEFIRIKVFDLLINNLKYSSEELRFHTLWAFANLATEDLPTKRLIMNSGIFQLCLDNLIWSISYKIKKEAAFVLANTLYNSDEEIINKAQELKILPKISNLLNTEPKLKNNEYNVLLLSIIDIMLQNGEINKFQNNDVNNLAMEFISCNGIFLIDNILTNNQNNEMAHIANNIQYSYLNNMNID